jgi:hypothetical protein
MKMKRLEYRIKIIVVVALVGTVLFGGFATPSVYANVNNFTSEFGTVGVAICSGEV